MMMMTALGGRQIVRHGNLLLTGLKFVQFRAVLSTTVIRHSTSKQPFSDDISQEGKTRKLIYEGKLSNRILYLKSISILSSVGLAASYSYVLSQKGLSVGLFGLGFAFTPFLVSPFVIAWFFKRYITQLYYDPQTETYTAHHFGLLLRKRSHTFRRQDVVRSDVTSMLNTFTVGKKPFFLHDEDLKDVESIGIYKQMIGLDQDKIDNLNIKKKVDSSGI